MTRHVYRRQLVRRSKPRAKCRGFASWNGPCGDPDCASCFPGQSDDDEDDAFDADFANDLAREDALDDDYDPRGEP